MHASLLSAVTFTIAAIAVAAPASADSPFVDPYTVTSASGQWALDVDPSTETGAGKAHYSMKRAGDVVWEGDLPLTLRECVVSDRGVVVGYAYDDGYMGWDGKMITLVIGPEGNVIQRDEHPRHTLFFVDPTPPAEPRGEGVILDEPSGRAIVRAQERSTPIEWWVYDLSDGKKLAELAPTPPNQGDLTFSREIAARLVPGTVLIAVQWFVWERPAHSATFELLDQSGQRIWSRRIDGEYTSRPERWNWWDLISDNIEQLAVRPAAFSTVSYKEGKRTHYALSKGQDGQWSVTQTGSEDAQPEAAPRGATLTTRPGSLHGTSEITLGPPQRPAVIDSIHSLSIDGAGRMGWVRWVRPDQRFTLVDQDGKTIADVLLPAHPDEKAQLASTTWLDGDRWVVCQTAYKEKQSVSRAWFLDASSGALTPLEGFAADSVKRIVRIPGPERSGFAILAMVSAPYTIMDSVARFDADGKLVSSRTEPGYGRGEIITDIAALSDGSLALLTGVANTSAIKLITPDGTPGRTINLQDSLAAALDPGMPYFAHICADRDGGLVVYDSAHQNHLHRLSGDGKALSSFHVRGPKDEPFRLYDAFAVAPDGRIWASDGSRLYRCTDTGKADLALGGPAEGSMAEPVAVCMDPSGRIYAIEKGTAAVHVFDERGTPLRVMRPGPSDTPTQDALAWIVAADDGSVRYRMGYEAPVIGFDPDGRQVPAKSPAPDWKRGPDDYEPIGRGWERGVGRIRRLGADGTLGPAITHRPDGAWLISIIDASAAPDGSLALLCQRETPGLWFSPARGPMWLCVYSPAGEGRTITRLERTTWSPHISFDGSRVLLTDEKGFTLLDPPTAATGTRFDLPGNDAWWHIMPRPDGTIAAWQSGSYTITTWKRPEQPLNPHPSPLLAPAE